MRLDDSSLERTGESDTPAAIFPLLSGKGNQRLLLEWIEEHDEYTLVDPETPLESAVFDCCILDGEALKSHGEVLRDRKLSAEPILEPYLLLLPDADISVLDVDQGEVADGVLFDTVDEIVSLPMKTAELEWRTESLLRLRTQSQQVVRQQRDLELFKKATEAAGHAVYITDSDGEIEYVNPAFEEMTGYDAEAVLGETPEILDSGEMGDDYFERLWDTISGGDVWEEDLVNRRQDGELYHAHQTIAPVDGGTGDSQRFVAIQSDITERVKSEQRLKTFQDIVQHIDDPIMLQDRAGDFQIFNTALMEHADRSREELVGSDEFDFMDELSATKIAARKQQVLEQERMVQYSISPELPGNSTETFSTLRYPYYGEQGDVQGTVAICRTVTDLERRNDQLAVIDRVLRHNLRNSMTTIQLFAEKLEQETPVTQAEYARRIGSTADEINRLVEKQRRVTKFLVDPPSEKVLDMADIVAATADRLRRRYPEASISCDGVDSCSITVTPAIEEVVEELIENGIVHAETDSPAVAVRLVRETDAVRVEITDEARQIPEMDREVLTSGQSGDALYHGSGLGLWLVNSIVAHAGGSIELSTQGTRGNTVELQLPVD